MIEIQNITINTSSFPLSGLIRAVGHGGEKGSFAAILGALELDDDSSYGATTQFAQSVFWGLQNFAPNKEMADLFEDDEMAIYCFAASLICELVAVRAAAESIGIYYPLEEAARLLRVVFPLAVPNGEEADSVVEVFRGLLTQAARYFASFQDRQVTEIALWVLAAARTALCPFRRGALNAAEAYIRYASAPPQSANLRFDAWHEYLAAAGENPAHEAAFCAKALAALTLDEKRRRCCERSL